ncbi:MAG: glycosyltransferase family 4 protein [Candidatus Eisenbacteria bacterium]|nr:glycosyltransferase family 4 protein [Candidatus Eisenbacteria bacterium]
MNTPAASGRVRVLLLTDLLEMGGAETQLVELAHQFEAIGSPCEVAVLRPGGALVPRLPRPPHRFRSHRPADPRLVIELARLVREQAIEVILTTHVWSLLHATALRRVLPGAAPLVVATVHGYRRPAASPLLEPIWRHALRHADRVIAVSRAQADWLLEAGSAREAQLVVLPNAIEPSRFEPRITPIARGDGNRVLLCLARLVPEKDHLTLLEAYRFLLQHGGPAPHLALVGDGPLRAELEARAREISRQYTGSRVEFVGQVDDARPWLAGADLAVLASRHESQGIALLEAMATALPVVATRVGGIPEVVEDGVTGLLVPPGQPRALADALRRLLADDAQAFALGQAGRTRVERRFSLAARAEAMMRVFQQLRSE